MVSVADYSYPDSAVLCFGVADITSASILSFSGADLRCCTDRQISLYCSILRAYNFISKTAFGSPTDHGDGHEECYAALHEEFKQLDRELG
jgi:hypothetical protein